MNKKSPANAKGNAQQRCMLESLVRTKSKLTDPSNNVFFTLARGRQTTGLAQPYWLSIYSVSLKLARAAYEIFSIECRLQQSKSRFFWFKEICAKRHQKATNL